jgi:hypothetical protein
VGRNAHLRLGSNERIRSPRALMGLSWIALPKRLARTQVIALVGKFARLTPAGAPKVIFCRLAHRRHGACLAPLAFAFHPRACAFIFCSGPTT